MNEIGRKIADKLIEIAGTTDFTIAFLPYKRSMWNCMESVYEELIASGVDAHCMPIPYWRMKENRQKDYIDTDFYLFGDIAEDVALLDGMHPRFVAIHYPFDNNNRVTNMLPEFYTAAIKTRYNAEIVFLPYGIAVDQSIKINNKLSKGVATIDYMFTYSENDRLNAIEAWSHYGIDYSNRIFAFGSPKQDAARKAKCIIPDEWQPILGDRPVTLLCNSLGAFLQQPYERLMLYQQMAQREIDRGSSVIFRPHPLLRTTIKSMLPDTESAYTRLLVNLRKLPHTIIDESEYLERAIGIAEHLVTDPSSITFMWQATGKTYEVI